MTVAPSPVNPDQVLLKFRCNRLVQASNIARKWAHLDVFCSYRVLGDLTKVYEAYVTMIY
jgi:hypothetical protein